MVDSILKKSTFTKDDAGLKKFYLHFDEVEFVDELEMENIFKIWSDFNECIVDFIKIINNKLKLI